MVRCRPWFCAALLLSLAFGTPVRAEALVVVAHPDAPALSQEDIAAIYMGRRGALRPLDSPVASPLYATFYRRLTGRSVIEVRAAWATVVFTGRGRAPAVKDSAEEIKRAIAADPGTMGYLEQSDVDARVRVLLVLPDGAS